MDGAELLASYLAREGVDREALAAAVGTVPDMLYQWATRRRRPNGDNRFRLEAATGSEVPAHSWSIDSKPKVVLKRRARSAA